MRLIYTRPILKDLSQGSRIAFVRQFRRMTQDYVSDKLEITGANKRRTMTRYEKGERNPNDDRALELSAILNVNFNAIKRYDYKNPIDICYVFLWLEELMPNFQIDLSMINDMGEEYIAYIKRFMLEWNTMKEKKQNKEILYEDYIEWKITYKGVE